MPNTITKIDQNKVMGMRDIPTRCAIVSGHAPLVTDDTTERRLVAATRDEP